MSVVGSFDCLKGTTFASSGSAAGKGSRVPTSMNSPLTLQSLLSHFLDPVGRMLDKAQSRTKGCWPWIVVCVAVALAFVLRMPPYHEMAAFPSTPYGKALTWWLDHPFSSIPVDDFFPLSTRHVNNNAGCASHCDKIAVRVTLPLLNQLFHGGIWTLVAASNLEAVLIFYLVIDWSFATRKMGSRPALRRGLWPAPIRAGSGFRIISSGIPSLSRY